MNKQTVYIVGPLFSEAESKQRQYEGKILKDYFEKNQIKYEIFNPIDMPLNEKPNVTSDEIALADYLRLNQSNVVFFDLSTEDSGSCVALGIIIEKFHQGKDIQIYPVVSDIRLARNYQGGLESSCGFNSMVIGILKAHDIDIYSNFEEAFNAYVTKGGE